MNTRGVDLADTLYLHICALKLPLPVREYCAISGRNYRCDLAWPERWLCVEVDGGERMQGRHSRAAGMASDCEKQNLLVLAGWKPLRFTGGQVRSGVAIAFLERYFAAQQLAFLYLRSVTNEQTQP